MSLSDHFYFEEGPSFRCVAKSDAAKAAVERLHKALEQAQTRLRRANALAKDAVNATTVLSAQTIVAALSPWVLPPDLVRSGLSVDGSVIDMIKRAAQHCSVIAEYIDNVLVLFPQALVAAPPIRQTPPVSNLPIGTTFFKPINTTKLLAVGAGLATIGGAVLVAKRAKKKTDLRFVDRSDKLFELAGMPEPKNDDDTEDQDDHIDDEFNSEHAHEHAK